MRNRSLAIERKTGSGYLLPVFRYLLLVTRYPLLVFFTICSVYATSDAQGLLAQMKDETLSYFTPLKGRVVSVKDGEVLSDLNLKSGAKKGMRLVIFKEGVPFLHPVTKEPIGRIETPVGKAEVREAAADNSRLSIIKGDVNAGDLLRISEMKVRMLFYQDKSVDWSLGDAYYQILKETGRFEMLDTPLNSATDSQVIEEAKKLNADVILILTAKAADSETLLSQRLLWTDNGSAMLFSEIKVDRSLIKELQAGKMLFLPPSTAADALMTFDLSYTAQLITVGDIDGNSKQELIISTGKDIRVLSVGAGIETAYEIKGSVADEHIWMETIDIDSDNKDEILVVSLKGNDAQSSIYGLKGSEFSLIWKDRLFVRKLDNGLIAQAYSSNYGFDGPVFRLEYAGGGFKKGGALKLPKGVNIYDFVYLKSAGNTDHLLAYDNQGFLNLYNSDGVRIWKSKDDYGGFLNSFGKGSSENPADAGLADWSVKNRLFSVGSEVFALKRIPLAEAARGLGYKKSQIRVLTWTGFSLEEQTIIDGISGGILDYAFAGDRLVAVSKPLFGIKVQNILKGESPFGNMLYIYSLSGLAAR